MPSVLAGSARSALVVVGVEIIQRVGDILHRHAGRELRQRESSITAGGNQRGIGQANGPPAGAPSTLRTVGDREHHGSLAHGVLSRHDPLLALIEPIWILSLSIRTECVICVDRKST